jgi:hypothetical protein
MSLWQIIRCSVFGQTKPICALGLDKGWQLKLILARTSRCSWCGCGDARRRAAHGAARAEVYEGISAVQGRTHRRAASQSPRPARRRTLERELPRSASTWSKEQNPERAGLSPDGQPERLPSLTAPPVRPLVLRQWSVVKSRCTVYARKHTGHGQSPTEVRAFGFPSPLSFGRPCPVALTRFHIARGRRTGLSLPPASQCSRAEPEERCTCDWDWYPSWRRPDTSSQRCRLWNWPVGGGVTFPTYPDPGTSTAQAETTPCSTATGLAIRCCGTRPGHHGTV